MRSIPMHPTPLRAIGRAFAALTVAALAPAAASAQSSSATPTPGPWKYTLSVYSYLPTIRETTAFPTGSGGQAIEVDAEQILERLKMTLMGSFEAHNGRWGVFSDLLYTDLGDGKQNSRSFVIGNAGIPATTTADLDWDYKSTLWTLGVAYRLVANASTTVDVLGGVRMFDQRQRLRWSITGDIGTLPPASRSGSSEVKDQVWDGIVGIKGRHVFGDSGRWSVPFYVDIGTGGSDSTAHVAAGLGYAFSWGDVVGVWRYVSYHPKSGSALDSMSFSGPQFGAVVRW